MERARSCLSTHFRSHREGVCGQKHMSIHFRAVLHSWAEDTQLGQDFVAARCLTVCDIKGNECTTTVAGFRSIDNAELQSQLSCLPNPTQNALRGAPASTASSQSTSLQCTSVGLYNTLPFVPNPACDTAQIGLAHVQGHGIAVCAFHRNHPEWLQSNRKP